MGIQCAMKYNYRFKEMRMQRNKKVKMEEKTGTYLLKTKHVKKNKERKKTKGKTKVGK